MVQTCAVPVTGVAGFIPPRWVVKPECPLLFISSSTSLNIKNHPVKFDSINVNSFKACKDFSPKKLYFNNNLHSTRNRWTKALNSGWGWGCNLNYC